MLESKTLPEFFLFRLIPRTSRLLRDESSMMNRTLCTVAFFILVIDLLAILFFVQTNQRLDVVENHNFTQMIIKGVRDSVQSHEEYSVKAKELIFAKKNFVRQMAHQLNFDSENLQKIETPRIRLDGLERMKTSVDRLINASPKEEVELLDEAIKYYKRLEDEVVELNNYLMPLDLLANYNAKMEGAFKVITEEIDRNMENFHLQILSLSEEQLGNQKTLRKEFMTFNKSFKQAFDHLHDGEKFRKVNNFYAVEFTAEEGVPLPMIENLETGIHSIVLTKSLIIDLKLPRYYFCVLKGIVRSEKDISIFLRYTDSEDSENKVIFESRNMKGGFGKEINYDAIHLFRLEKGEHSLQLEMISIGRNAHMILSNAEMKCISYRQFETSEESL